MSVDDFTPIFPYVIPILALLIPIVAIIAGATRRMRREQLMHETIRQLAERGVPIPPELFAQGRSAAADAVTGQLAADAVTGRWSKRDPASSRRSQLLGGAINIGIGLALALMFYVMDPSGWLWTIGCIPLFVGAAILLVVALERPAAVER